VAARTGTAAKGEEASGGTAKNGLRRLVIVESPAKARTIAGYLGKGYVVESSIGHIRDMPDKAASVIGVFILLMTVGVAVVARLCGLRLGPEAAR